jgi:hypothetical protein
MAVDFYTKWLDLPPGPRPPDYYTLLGVELFCDDLDAIEAATRQRLTRLDQFALHPDRKTREAVQDMMNQVARARVDLVNPNRRPDYDRRLAEQLGVPVPGQPETPAEEPEEAVSQPVVEEVVTAAEQFEKVVWKHLRKWKLNAHEQRLLMAEAAALGVPEEEAIGIIQRKDREAEILAEKKHKRQIAAVIGLSTGAVIVLIVGIMLFISSAETTRSQKEGDFVSVMKAARLRLEDGDPDAAERKLTKARTIIPDDPRLDELAAEILLKRKAVREAFTAQLSRARLLMDRGKLDQAVNELAKVSNDFREDAGYAGLLGEVTGKREEREAEIPGTVSTILASLKAGDLDAVDSKLSRARANWPDDARFKSLGRKLAERRAHDRRQHEDRNKIERQRREREQNLARAIADISTAMRAGNLKKAGDLLSKAQTAYPNEPKLADLRRKFDSIPRGRETGPAVAPVVIGAHTKPVWSIAFSPDGGRIVSGSIDRSVKIWDAATGKEVAAAKGPLGTVYAVAFSPDGKQVISGDQDGMVRVWDAATGRGVMSVEGHSGSVLSVACSPDGRHIASGGVDMTVRIWDASSGRKIATLGGRGQYVQGPLPGVFAGWEAPGLRKRHVEDLGRCDRSFSCDYG